MERTYSNCYALRALFHVVCYLFFLTDIDSQLFVMILSEAIYIYIYILIYKSECVCVCVCLSVCSRLTL
jgi:hypothetical protein